MMTHCCIAVVVDHVFTQEKNLVPAGAWSKHQTIQLRGAAVEADGRGHNLLQKTLRGPQVEGFPKEGIGLQ